MSKKSKMDNAAASAIPAPGLTTVHNHAPNPFLDYAGKVFYILAVLTIIWIALCFLFWQMGSYSPGQDAAQVVIYGGLIAGGMWFLSFLFNPYFESGLSFKLELEKEITRRVEANLLQAQTTLEPSRYTEADYDFARVVISVMANAYNWLEKEEYTAFPGRWRPWSLSSSKKTADEIGVKISQDKANEVSKWLHERGVITDPVNGQITKKFPNLTNVKVLLDNEFGPGVIRQVSPTIRQNRGFKFTD